MKKRNEQNKAGTVIVCGGGGYVGAPIVDAFVHAGSRVHVLSRTASRSAGLWPRKAVACHDIDLLSDGACQLVGQLDATLLVQAAWTTEHGTCWTDRANLDWLAATVTLAAAFRRAGGRRFIGIGTCAEYDFTDQSGFFAETAATDRAHSLYGRCKASCARLVHEFADDNFSVAWARLFHSFGPREDARRLVPSIVLNLLAGREASVSSGIQTRDFMHVEQIGKAVAALALSNVAGPVNVASGEANTIASVARTIGNIIGRPDLVRLGALPDRSEDPLIVLANTKRLREEVGFCAPSSVHAGLESTVKWWSERNRVGP